MSEVKWPKCGNTHQSNSKLCVFCGENLELIILEYKEKNLPVNFNRGGKNNLRARRGKRQSSGIKFLDFLGSCALDTLCEALCGCL